MRLMLITCTPDADTGEFPLHPLQEVEGEVISVVDHFYIQAGVPRLLLMVHHEPPRVRREVVRPSVGKCATRAACAGPARGLVRGAKAQQSGGGLRVATGLRGRR